MASADIEHPATGHGGAYRQPFTFAVAAACAGHPVRLARCLRLEAACFAAWPALEEERRGNLLLRAAGGYSMRINSGVPLLPPGADATWREGHVRDAEAWFAARGLPPQFRLPEPLEGEGPSGAGGLDPLLAAMGYTATDPTLVQELDLLGWPGCPVAPCHAEGTRSGEVRLPNRQCAIVDHATWLAAEGGVRGRIGADAVNPVLRGLLATLGPGGQTWLLRADGQSAVCGLGVRTGDDYGIFAVVAHPDLRRQGLGRRLVSAMLGDARQDGARTAWLQVGQGNTAARALYEGLGFATTYGYWYRVRR